MPETVADCIFTAVDTSGDGEVNPDPRLSTAVTAPPLVGPSLQALWHDTVGIPDTLVCGPDARWRLWRTKVEEAEFESADLKGIFTECTWEGAVAGCDADKVAPLSLPPVATANCRVDAIPPTRRSTCVAQ